VEGIKGFFQGQAQLTPNSTIIISSFSRDKDGTESVYHLHQFLDQQNNILYQESEQENNLPNLCASCAGAGYQTMFARVINSSSDGQLTHINFIPLAID